MSDTEFDLDYDDNQSEHDYESDASYTDEEDGYEEDRNPTDDKDSDKDEEDEDMDPEIDLNFHDDEKLYQAQESDIIFPILTDYELDSLVIYIATLIEDSKILVPDKYHDFCRTKYGFAEVIARQWLYLIREEDSGLPKKLIIRNRGDTGIDVPVSKLIMPWEITSKDDENYNGNFRTGW